MHPPKSIHFFISMTLLISLLLFLVWHCLHFYQLLVFVLIHFARKVQEKMIRHYLQNYITVSQLKPVLIRVLTGFIKWGNKVKNLDIPSLRSCMSLFFTCISLLINRSQLIKTVFLRNLYQISYIMSYYPIHFSLSCSYKLSIGSMYILEMILMTNRSVSSRLQSSKDA
jgi:hypothetical protein